eukprot:498837-Rhodomonas_salina.2
MLPSGPRCSQISLWSSISLSRSAFCLYVCCATSGTDRSLCSYLATCAGTDSAYGAMSLRACDGMSGTDVAYQECNSTCAIRITHHFLNK